MKKIGIFVTLLFLVITTGCEKVEEEGAYKEGTYFGFSQSESYGKTYTTTAVIYVNENGKIASVYLDSTYEKDGISTTKKTLGDDYAMKETSANIGNISGGAEWYEQVETLENKIIEEQGTDFVKWSTEDSSKLDAVSGVTISATDFVKAINNALADAKK